MVLYTLAGATTAESASRKCTAVEHSHVPVGSRTCAGIDVRLRSKPAIRKTGAIDLIHNVRLH